MLNTYLAQTRRLLQNPGAPTTLYSDTDLTAYINTARGQLAGEAQCIRYLGTVSTTVAAQEISFAAINTGVTGTTGIQGVLNVTALWYGVGSGMQWVSPRPWPWFSLYELNNPVPGGGFATAWSQYKQGSAKGSTGSGSSGSFYISPVPDTAYTLYADCVCYPNALANDTDVEAIPYLWTDAVAWYAAAYALWSSQTNARTSDAERYFNTYTMFVDRARKFSNPEVGRWQYPQAADPAQAAKMGLKPPQGAG